MFSYAKATSQQVYNEQQCPCPGPSPPLHQGPGQAIQAHAELHHPVSVRSPTWSPPASGRWIKMVNSLGWMIR